jgi:hypothetical protein
MPAISRGAVLASVIGLPVAATLVGGVYYVNKTHHDFRQKQLRRFVLGFGAFSLVAAECKYDMTPLYKDLSQRIDALPSKEDQKELITAQVQGTGLMSTPGAVPDEKMCKQAVDVASTLANIQLLVPIKDGGAPSDGRSGQ